MSKNNKKPADWNIMLRRIIKWLYANKKVDSLVVKKKLIKDICAPVVGGTSYNYVIPRFYYALEDGLIEIHHGSKIVLTGPVHHRNKHERVSRDYDNKKIRKKINERKGNRETERRRKKRESKEFYYSREWRELRVKALVKYGRKCCLCGRGVEDGIVLHVDHIKPRSKRPDLELDINNLQILCEDCNLGKSNRYSEDWRIQPQSRVADLYKD